MHYRRTPFTLFFLNLKPLRLHYIRKIRSVNSFRIQMQNACITRHTDIDTADLGDGFAYKAQVSGFG